MSANSKIEWCEATWNFLAGCSLVSPGCTNCYAMRAAHRLAAMGQKKYAGTTKKVNGKAVWTGLVNVDEPTFTLPLRTRKPTVWFVNSMSDLFHESVPDEVIDRAFAVMALTPRHTYQILTKRPERMAAWCRKVSRSFATWEEAADHFGVPRPDRSPQARAPVSGAVLPYLPNVWLGVSCEDQQRADERIPHLLATPAAVRFVSAEPLLGEVGIFGPCPYHNPVADGELPVDCGGCDGFGHAPLMTLADRIHWVIVGGESGPGARPCHVEWVRSVVRQCKAAGVACFVKQLGAVPVMCADAWRRLSNAGPAPLLDHRGHRELESQGYVRIHLSNPKGGAPEEWPEDLRVRDYPEVRK